MFADIPTMLLMVTTVSLAMTLCLGAVWRPQLRDGTGFWALALGLNTLAHGLFMLRGEISDYLTIVLANTLLVSVYALFSEGLLQFQRRQLPRWLIWWPVLVVPPLFIALLDEQIYRTIANSLILMLQSLLLLIIVLLGRSTTAGRGQYFVFLGLLLMIGTLSHRMVAALLGMDIGMGLSSTSTVQTLTFVNSNLALILGSMGLILMTKERADERNRQLAMHDELTGLPNRRACLDGLGRMLAQTQRNATALTLMMIDIDHFKAINDNYGHQSGDAVLRTMSNCISDRLRMQDLAGRIGGEEFLVILPDTDLQGAKALAENLRQSIEAADFVTDKGQPLQVTVSIGLHSLRTESDGTINTLISNADQAMYRAKQMGRNRVESLS
ncbi:MAG: GGDEF domain-containing protein [Gammaproteobacteria bacterium HGW-Gammaproteobacteria-11]|nr:MAG: GGDEF domain-containing protein [Gammaproteobacteria bacterium HGW-Gammaproteobacteria-11]